MNDRVTIKKSDNSLKFYLHNDRGVFWLFEQKYTKNVYDWFLSSRSLSEIKSFKGWGRNPRLDKTIERIPREVTYVTKYIIPTDKEIRVGAKAYRQSKFERTETA